MRFLSLARVLRLHERVIAQSGGASGVRDLGRIQAALDQPRATFDEEELYPTLADKAAALAFSLIQGHPFVDGNKRIGHAAMAVFLRLNGANLVCAVDEQEQVILGVASGELSRRAFTEWVRNHIETAAL
jgi:death on curing protein